MTAVLPESPVSPALANKDLISDHLWVRLTNRIVKDEDGMVPALAERIMDQTLGFLRLCAEKTKDESYSPSSLVDIGWHTFILYTRDYAEFCERMAGRFIHHNPSDEEGVDYGMNAITSTVAAMKARGIGVDEPLWAATKADCNCSGGGCNAGPDCGD